MQARASPAGKLFVSLVADRDDHVVGGEHIGHEHWSGPIQGEAVSTSDTARARMHPVGGCGASRRRGHWAAARP